MQMIKSIVVFFLFMFVQSTFFAFSSSFKEIVVNDSISFDIPRNWVIMSDNKTITLNSIIESALHVSSNIRFQANLKDDNGNPITTVQIYLWKSESFQTDIFTMSKSDVDDYNQKMRKQMNSELNAVGGSISNWHGTRKQNLNNLTVLVSEYSRPANSAPFGHFRVQILRVYAGENSFSFVVSYHEQNSLPLDILVDKIISTLRCKKCM